MKNILRFRKNIYCPNDEYILASVSVDVYWDGVWIHIGELNKVSQKYIWGVGSYQWYWGFTHEIAQHMGTRGERNQPLYVSKRKIKRQFLENLRYFGGYLNKKAKQENDDEL